MSEQNDVPVRRKPKEFYNQALWHYQRAGEAWKNLIDHASLCGAALLKAKQLVGLPDVFIDGLPKEIPALIACDCIKLGMYRQDPRFQEARQPDLRFKSVVFIRTSRMQPSLT